MAKNELKESFVNSKLLRRGYTTGSCSAAAAAAAAAGILSRSPISEVIINTPAGITLTIQSEETERDSKSATYFVVKDSGDDPDITNGVKVYAKVQLIEEQEIIIDGGKGIGRVTKKGLDQPVGAAAINSVPRSMIRDSLLKVAKSYSYTGGFSVIISIPDGERLAKRTFNPMLGIEGGISVLGTSGIVEPMSNAALINTIKTEISVLAADGAEVMMINIGNFGEKFSNEKLGLEGVPSVKSSNFIGDAIAFSIENSIKKIFIVGHVGKMVKLGIGMFNTHSSMGDGRIETFMACMVEAYQEKVDPLVLTKLSKCISSDSAVELLIEHNMLEKTMEVLAQRIEKRLEKRVADMAEIGFLCFNERATDDNQEVDAILCTSTNAEKMLAEFRTLAKNQQDQTRDTVQNKGN